MFLYIWCQESDLGYIVQKLYLPPQDLLQDLVEFKFFDSVKLSSTQSILTNIENKQ
jgi:hypothetical protein